MKAIGENKRCCKCHEWKRVGEFHQAKRESDGLQPYCKQCNREYRAENREKICELNRKYYAENSERERERNRKYYAENREKIRERALGRQVARGDACCVRTDA